VLLRQVPVFVNSPQVAQARGMSLRSLQGFAPTMLTEERLAAIDSELAKTPGTLTTNAAAPVSVPIDTYAALELRTVPLWEEPAPGALGNGRQDQPSLTLIGSDGAISNGAAVVVAPGGGYQGLATGHEGRQVGDWFAAHGIQAFVLSYRLVSFGYRHPTQLHDAQRAIRWVRGHAAEFGVDPQRIGMIGFSAGGHLTAMTSTVFDAGDPEAADPIDRVSSRPDFSVLVYPAILLTPEQRSRLNLFEGEPEAKALRQILPAQNVTRQTPPTFIVHTTADELVSPANSIAYYNALLAAHVPAEMHLFAQGRHGLGLGLTETLMGSWPDLLWKWLGACGFLLPDALSCVPVDVPAPPL
jgi:acetyl esterase/lipase